MLQGFTRKNVRVEAVGRGWSTTSRHHDILREFMTRWRGRRPLPWGMLNTFNNAGVGDYTWFFRNWLFGYNYSDLTLDGVQSADGGHAVVVRNPGGMAVPFDVVQGFTDGSSERVRRTPAAWQADRAVSH